MPSELCVCSQVSTDQLRSVVHWKTPADARSVPNQRKGTRGIVGQNLTTISPQTEMSWSVFDHHGGYLTKGTSGPKQIKALGFLLIGTTQRLVCFRQFRCSPLTIWWFRIDTLNRSSTASSASSTAIAGTTSSVPATTSAIATAASVERW